MNDKTMAVEQWLGEDNTIGIDIFKRKYLRKDETLDEWFDRVSAGDEALRRVIVEKKFLFAGRVLANRGTDTSGSLSNCYSYGYVEDDYEDIMDAAKKIGLTFKGQGGQGVSLSKLRPKGAPIGKDYTSDGIVPFMKIFNEVTDSTSQGGARKGALMISLDATHKEAMDFIKIKSEQGMIEKANLSLEIDDTFMDCVERTKTTGQDAHIAISKNYSGHNVQYEVNPSETFRALAENAWDWGDPACLFTERMRNYNLMQYVPGPKVESTNPCFTGDMKLLTADGYKEFRELDGEHFFIINSDGDICRSYVFCNGEKDIVEVKFINHPSITCTADHAFMTTEYDETRAEDLKEKQILPFVNHRPTLDREFIKYGFIQGDGNLTRLSSKRHHGVEVNIGKKDGDILVLFRDNEYTSSGDRVIYVSDMKDKLIALGFSQEKLPDRKFPSSYEMWDKIEKASFLNGCFSANGCIVRGHRIQYKTTSAAFAEQLKSTLRDDFGMSPYITTNKPKEVDFDNGTYLCRQSYDVCLTSFKDIVNFSENIGFYQKYKKLRLRELLIKRSPKVVDVIKLGKEKVYDFTEPLTHWGVVEGFVAHNCGEQPLFKHGACCLGSINLAEFVKNPFSEAARFDLESFYDTVKIGINALDVIVDENIERHPLPEQREMAERYRNIGLGVMGYADALMMLRLKYGSPEAIQFTDSLFCGMLQEAVSASAENASTKGSFPGYDGAIWNSDFIRYNYFKNDADEFKEAGFLRNCSLLSVAPTGTLSTVLGISGGIEPHFALKYTRRTVGATDGDDTYYDVYCKTAQQYLDISGEKELPDYFVTSADIPWKNRIDTQAVAQSRVDTGISSTINLPNSATVEDVENIFFYAWKAGLKGITVFRDGCKRVGILTTSKQDDTEENKQDEQEELAPLKRGDIIQHNDDNIIKIRSLQSGCGKVYVHAHFDPDTGNLIEVFLDRGGSGGCERYMNGLSRMMSLAARGGIGTPEIIDQLMSVSQCAAYISRRVKFGDASKGTCCPGAIGYALKEMWEEVKDELFDDDEKDEVPRIVLGVPSQGSHTVNPLAESLKQAVAYKQGDKTAARSTTRVMPGFAKCPECGDTALTNESGCNVCKACGYSRCG